MGMGLGPGEGSVHGGDFTGYVQYCKSKRKLVLDVLFVFGTARRRRRCAQARGLRISRFRSSIVYC
eukprot:scaffold24998_cov129-Isochrysis_galbana.AAC.7